MSYNRNLQVNPGNTTPFEYSPLNKIDITLPTTMNNNTERSDSNSSLISLQTTQTTQTTPNQLCKDFHSWIRGHENLYNCIQKMKDFILDNAFLLFLLLVVVALAVLFPPTLSEPMVTDNVYNIIFELSI